MNKMAHLRINLLIATEDQEILQQNIFVCILRPYLCYQKLYGRYHGEPSLEEGFSIANLTKWYALLANAFITNSVTVFANIRETLLYIRDLNLNLNRSSTMAAFGLFG